jgi:hypothetical protein
MGHASRRKDEGMQRIGGCAFLSVFLCWLIVTADQLLAADSRSGVVATATQWLALTGTGL